MSQSHVAMLHMHYTSNVLGLKTKYGVPIKTSCGINSYQIFQTCH